MGYLNGRSVGGRSPADDPAALPGRRPDHTLFPCVAERTGHDMSTDGPKQVDSPDYHSENHTASQTCGWTANAL